MFAVSYMIDEDQFLVQGNEEKTSISYKELEISVPTGILYVYLDEVLSLSKARRMELELVNELLSEQRHLREKGNV